MRTIRVTLPIDGSIEPCFLCGSITVGLDNKPQPCPLHALCVECGYDQAAHPRQAPPQPCPIHACRACGGDG